MTSILVVCTGNVCRSPMAEGLLRAALRRRFGDAAPLVSSAGTHGWEGSAAMPGSVEAARELGVDITAHRGRLLTPAMAREAGLLLCMAGDHRAAFASERDLARRAFTLKEMVRLTEVLAPADADPERLAERVAEADAARERRLAPVSRDEDVADPLGQPPEAYRAVAWELETWIERLVAGLFGPASAEAVAGGS